MKEAARPRWGPQGPRLALAVPVFEVGASQGGVHVEGRQGAVGVRVWGPRRQAAVSRWPAGHTPSRPGSCRRRRRSTARSPAASRSPRPGPRCWAPRAASCCSRGSGWRRGRAPLPSAFTHPSEPGSVTPPRGPHPISVQLRDTPAFSHPSPGLPPTLTTSCRDVQKLPQVWAWGTCLQTPPLYHRDAPSPSQPGAISLSFPFSPIVQGALVHPDKFSLPVQVPEANPGALLVAVFGQEVLRSRAGLEGCQAEPGSLRQPGGCRGSPPPDHTQSPGPPAPPGCGC